MLILASSSPRRKEILEKFHYDFKMMTSSIDETPYQNEYPIDYVKRMSFEKARVVYQNHLDHCVIGVDTIVCLGNQIYGKAHDAEDAYKMLSSLSGKTHQVHTALTFLSAHHNQTIIATAHVTFKTLTNQSISDYIQTGEYVGKAGSYAIQGIGSRLIQSFDGDFYTIMGFPIIEFNEMLEKLNLREMFLNQ